LCCIAARRSMTRSVRLTSVFGSQSKKRRSWILSSSPTTSSSETTNQHQTSMRTLEIAVWTITNSTMTRVPGLWNLLSLNPEYLKWVTNVKEAKFLVSIFTTTGSELKMIRARGNSEIVWNQISIHLGIVGSGVIKWTTKRLEWTSMRKLPLHCSEILVSNEISTRYKNQCNLRVSKTRVDARVDKARSKVRKVDKVI
jgi:hypothetical protein